MIDESLELQTEAQNVPMSFPNSDGNEIQMAPLVQVTNLKEAIFTLLDRHQKYDSNCIINPTELLYYSNMHIAFQYSQSWKAYLAWWSHTTQ